MQTELVNMSSEDLKKCKNEFKRSIIGYERVGKLCKKFNRRMCYLRT